MDRILLTASRQQSKQVSAFICETGRDVSFDAYATTGESYMAVVRWPERPRQSKVDAVAAAISLEYCFTCAEK